jgi:hypothetical protein
MRKLMFLVALSILGTGQLKAATCTTGTLASYIALGAAGCQLNANWTIGSFSYTNQGTAAPTAAQQTITPITVGGFGFLDTPTSTWANSTEISDGEIQYIISFTGSITNIFQSISGSIAPTSSAAFDNITDDYCPGGTSLPPGGCVAGVQNLNTNLTGSETTESNSATFAAVSSVSVLKDVSANATGFPGGTATVTAFENLFNTATTTPEPSVLLMLGSGLLGLALLSGRRRRIV